MLLLLLVLRLRVSASGTLDQSVVVARSAAKCLELLREVVYPRRLFAASAVGTGNVIVSSASHTASGRPHFLQ